LMMASIFFTERLPGIFIVQTAKFVATLRVVRRLFDRCPAGQPGTHHLLPSSTIIQSRLPQKQGLCQVAKVA
jgi:hypothetical protein